MQADLKFGRSYEQLAEGEVLSRLFSHCTVQNVGRQKYWRRHGVDFVISDDVVNEKILLEVKADRHKTGNIVLELYTAMYEGERKWGWFHTTKADFIVYFVIERQQYLLIDIPKMRQLLLEHEFKLKTTNNPWGIVNFYVVPIAFMEEHFLSETVPDDTWQAWLAKYIS